MKSTIFASLFALAFANLAQAGEVTYRADIRPLWEARCAGCHGVHAPYLGEFAEDKEKYVALNQGPRMDTYADLLFFAAWPDTGALMRRLDDGRHGKDGKPGNMYVNLGDDEAERQRNLRLFKDWLGPGGWILKRPKEIGKEELMRITAPY